MVSFYAVQFFAGANLHQKMDIWACRDEELRFLCARVEKNHVQAEQLFNYFPIFAYNLTS